MTMKRALPLALTAIIAGTPTAEAHGQNEYDAQGRLSQYNCTDGETVYFKANIRYVGSTPAVREVYVFNKANETEERLTFDSQGKLYIEVAIANTNFLPQDILGSYSCDTKAETCTDLMRNVKMGASDLIHDRSLRSLEAYQSILREKNKTNAKKPTQHPSPTSKTELDLLPKER